MLSDEEKEAIDLLKNIDKQKCMMLECPVVKNNIERQLKIIELNRTIRKQSKEIEEYKKQLDLDYVDNHFVPIERYNQLKKEIEELKKENKEIRDWKYVIDNPIDLKKLSELDIIKIFGKSYIAKDIIKARIKELEEYLYRGSIKDDFLMIRIKAKIQELQSLLEKE